MLHVYGREGDLVGLRCFMYVGQKQGDLEGLGRNIERNLDLSEIKVIDLYKGETGDFRRSRFLLEEDEGKLQ